MKPKYWLVLGAVAISSLELVACSSDFSDCSASRSCAAGAGGSAGSSGASAASGTAGESGREEEPASEPPEAAAGEAGQGGGGGVTPDAEPALLGRCSVKGELACAGHAGDERLVCDGAVWQAGTTCGAGKLCDSTSGQCLKVVEECEAAEPGASVCRGDVPLTCGVDLVSAEEGEECEGLCKDGVCQAPKCGDGKKQTGEDCEISGENASSTCVKCKDPKCGDNVVTGEEQCDIGDAVPGDGCSATCKIEPYALALGEAVTCALSFTGVVKCWGENSKGTLGTGAVGDQGDDNDEEGREKPSKLPPVNFGAGRKAKAISAGGSVVCAILDNDDLKCWGSNEFGQLGQGPGKDKSPVGLKPDEVQKLPPIQLGTGLKAKAVSVGATHVCAILSDDSLKCWGSGQSGQLGQESDIDYPNPPSDPVNFKGKAVTAVSAGMANITCAQLGSITKCWGDAGYLSIARDPEQPTLSAIGDNFDEIVNLAPMNFGHGHIAKSVVAGGITCGILEDSLLRCWGPAFSGNAGSGNGQVGYTPDELVNLPFAPLGKPVESVAVGYVHTCALLEGGAVKCWGANPDGRLGTGDDVNWGKTADLHDLPALDFGGRSARHVYAGFDHTCAILDDGSVRCWGANEHGQLGLGSRYSLGNKPRQLASKDTLVDLTF